MNSWFFYEQCTVGEDDGGGSYSSFNCQIASNDFTTRNFFSLQSKMHFQSCLKVDFLLLLFLQESKLCVFSLLLHFQGRCSFHAQADNEVQITQSDILRNVFFQVLTFKSLKVSLLRKLRLMQEKKRVSYFVSNILNMEKGESLVNQFFRVDL